MSLGDITWLDNNNGTGTRGSVKYTCALNTTVINSGEMVAKTLGNTTGNVVIISPNNFPTVATDYTCGLAASTSTQTASAAGTVEVWPVNAQDILLATPDASTSFDTQAEYDALVGARVLLKLSSGAYTMLASDSANNGCVIQPLDISKYPNKVAFSIRAGAQFLA